MCDTLIQHRYDWTEIRPSRAGVMAIATLENVELADVDEPLSDRIDPEALDRIVADGRPVVVRFATNRYRVRIDGRELTIRPR